MILHTKVIGKGESLVFLHTGLQTGELDFIPQQAHFEKNYKVILPDLRGHGQSESEQVDVKSFFVDSAADLAETLEKLQIDQAHIVGASLGALVGLVFAKRYPEKTKSLTLSGISPEKPANWNELQAEDLKMQRAIFTNEEAVRYFDNIHKSDWRTFLKQSQTLDWYPFQETGDLSAVQCPTLLIVGEGMKHEVKGVLQYPKMNNLFHVAVLPFASHLVHSEQPELYSLIVEQFLGESKMTIKEIQAAETYPIRQSLRPHQDPSTCVYLGDEASTTFHLGAFKEGELIGIASFYKEKNPDFNQETQYQLRGMATSPDYRGMNIGKQLIIEAEAILKEKQVDLWWCNARIVAIGFYEKLGLSIHGEIFEIEPIGPHKVMFHELV